MPAVIYLCVKCINMQIRHGGFIGKKICFINHYLLGHYGNCIRWNIVWVRKNYFAPIFKITCISV